MGIPVGQKGVNSNEDMIRGAHLIQDIQEKLLRACPVLPQQPMLVFKGKDPVIFWFLGQKPREVIRIWYKDKALEVCDLDDLNISSSAVWITPGGCSDEARTYISPQQPFFSRLEYGRYQRKKS